MAREGAKSLQRKLDRNPEVKLEPAPTGSNRTDPADEQKADEEVRSGQCVVVPVQSALTQFDHPRHQRPTVYCTAVLSNVHNNIVVQE